VPRGEIADDEAADVQALGQDRAHHLAGPCRRCLAEIVVLRDQAADRHARESVEQREHRLEHRAADILEIDVDASRTGRLQFRRQIGIAVIEAIVETEFIPDVIAFVLAPRSRPRARP